jgi:hypothetical protein
MMMGWWGEKKVPPLQKMRWTFLFLPERKNGAQTEGP